MDKLWYKKLEEQVVSDFNQFKKKYSKEKLKNFVKNCDLNHFFFVTFANDTFTISKNKKNYTGDCYKIDSTKQFLTKMLEYIKKNNLPPIKGTFIFNRKDGYNFDLNLPVINYSKPSDQKGFLQPDFNFHQFEEKREAFKTKCPTKKKDLIFFKGSKTSTTRSRVREFLEKEKEPFKVDLNEKKLPFYCVCHYKYVLDLPGKQPWSVRLIELLMSRSLPIRIRFYYSKYEKAPWIQFFEKMFPHQVCLDYDVNYSYVLDKKVVKKIVSDITTIYEHFENNPQLYQKLVTQNWEKVEALKWDHLSFYYYTMFTYYNKLFE